MDHISWSNLTKYNRIVEIYDENGLVNTYITLRSLRPNKGKNMNVTPNTNTVDTVDNVAQKPYYIDAEGNRVEIPFDVDSDGETAPTETTLFVAEDSEDHPVTVH